MGSVAPQPEAAETILVVEDEALIRFMVAETFEEQGYRVLEADSAAAARQLLEEHPEVAAMVTDVRMANPLDGLELARWVRKQRPQTKIVVTSGYVSDAEWRKFSDSFDRFVGKPYTPAELVSIVERLFE